MAGWGGSGTNITAPPPTGNFSNASLNGQYAFSMSGVDLNTGAFVARVGSFAADGQGHFTTGLDDALDLGSGSAGSLGTFSDRTYQIQANGRGLIALKLAGGASLPLRLSLLPNSRGYRV